MAAYAVTNFVVNVSSSVTKVVMSLEVTVVVVDVDVVTGKLVVMVLNEVQPIGSADTNEENRCAKSTMPKERILNSSAMVRQVVKENGDGQEELSKQLCNKRQSTTI